MYIEPDRELYVYGYSHFASLLSADEQRRDSDHHGDEEHAGTNAFDDTTQRLWRSRENKASTKLNNLILTLSYTLSAPMNCLLSPLILYLMCFINKSNQASLPSVQTVNSPASVTTGRDMYVSVNRGDAMAALFFSSSKSCVNARTLSLEDRTHSRTGLMATLVNQSQCRHKWSGHLQSG